MCLKVMRRTEKENRYGINESAARRSYLLILYLFLFISETGMQFIWTGGPEWGYNEFYEGRSFWRLSGTQY